METPLTALVGGYFFDRDGDKGTSKLPPALQSGVERAFSPHLLPPLCKGRC